MVFARTENEDAIMFAAVKNRYGSRGRVKRIPYAVRQLSPDDDIWVPVLTGGEWVREGVAETLGPEPT